MIVDVDEENEQGAYPGMILVANLSEMTSGQGTYVYLTGWFEDH